MRLAGIRIAILAAWAAALLSYAAFAVYPAFQVGIAPQSAADLLAHGFVGLDRAGLIAGLAAVLLARAARAGSEPRVWLPALGAVIHAASLFLVTPGIEALRHAGGGAIGGLADDPSAVDRFALLHRASQLLYVSACCVALVALIWDLLRLPSGRAKTRKVA